MDHLIGDKNSVSYPHGPCEDAASPIPRFNFSLSLSAPRSPGEDGAGEEQGPVVEPDPGCELPPGRLRGQRGGLDTTGVCLSGSECNARSGIIIGQF